MIPLKHAARFSFRYELHDRGRLLVHEHHEAAANEIETRLAGRAKMIVAAAALVEAHAVLTRLPPPHRLSPQTALTLLENNFIKLATVVALNAKSYEMFIAACSQKRRGGWSHL